LTASTRRKAIVLITDGYDENSESKVDQATDALKRSGITLYVVGLGGIAGVSLKGEKLLSHWPRTPAVARGFPVMSAI
jgi:hypothetical protein